MPHFANHVAAAVYATEPVAVVRLETRQASAWTSDGRHGLASDHDLRAGVGRHGLRPRQRRGVDHFQPVPERGVRLQVWIGHGGQFLA